MASRRTCVLGVVLALLCAPVMNAPSVARRCHQCPATCPMHTQRAAGCHHANGPRCHEAAAGLALRRACHHQADAGVPVPSFRGIMRAVAPASPAVVAEPLVLSSRLVHEAPSPEPPIHPPRAPFVRG